MLHKWRHYRFERGGYISSKIGMKLILVWMAYVLYNLSWGRRISIQWEGAITACVAVNQLFDLLLWKTGVYISTFQRRSGPVPRVIRWTPKIKLRSIPKLIRPTKMFFWPQRKNVEIAISLKNMTFFKKLSLKSIDSFTSSGAPSPILRFPCLGYTWRDQQIIFIVILY